MRVVYHVESHTSPRQLARLVRRLLAGSDETVVVVNHDSRSTDDLGAIQALDRVHVMRSPGGYADFSHVRRYLETLEWLRREGVAYDWVANLSGQDYPLRDLASAQAELGADGLDGYVQWFQAFDPASPWGARLGRSRYTYRYRRLRGLSARQKRLLQPVQAVNYVQPWVRVTVATGLTVGRRRSSTPFGPDLVCYGGSLFLTLSRPAAEYVLDHSLEHPDLVSYYATCLSPAESYLQTVLLNSHRFRLSPDCRRYFDFSRTKLNHPKVLTADDLPALLASGADFGRKFDERVDAEVLDQLDALAHAGSRE
jgi:hypothetical protein